MRNMIATDNPDVLSWIRLIGDILHPPSDEQRMALRVWLAQHENNLHAFRRYCTHVMALFDSPSFSRMENPAYKYFIVESVYAQLDAARIVRGETLTTPTPVPPVSASESH